MPTGGGGGGGGLNSVTTNATLTGAGTSGSPLAVAAPYNAAAPGALGGTTSNTGQFTQVAIGASAPTLPGTTGNVLVTNELIVGTASASGNLGTISAAATGANAGGTIVLGTGSHQASIVSGVDAGANQQISIASTVNLGIVYIQIRQGVAFASLPAPAAGLIASIACVNNSTVNTFGATVAGGGANKVLCWCNGTVWTVIGI